MNIYHDLNAITDVAIHHAKEHNCNYNVILMNPVDGVFGNGSTYEYVADSYFEKERNCILLHKTDDIIKGEETLDETGLHYERKGDKFIVEDFGEQMDALNEPKFIDFELKNTGMSYWPRQRPRIEPRRVEKTPSRNEPCSCGSGKKYKKCCGR